MAIDSGLEKTGYAVFEKDKNYKEGFKYINSGLILTSKKDQKENRLKRIYRQLLRVISFYKPGLLVLEELFFFKNLKTAISIAQSQGVILLLASQKKIPIEFLTPLQIKQIITGFGRADKKAVQKMISLTLNLPPIKQDDQADAVACGLAYCYINKKLL